MGFFPFTWLSVSLGHSSVLRPRVPLDHLPLHTEGSRVVDAQGRRFKLKCVNWYGGESDLYVVEGLHKRNMSDIIELVLTMGFNCVRLPFSLSLIFDNHSVPPHAVAATAAWGEDGRTPPTGLVAFDATIRALTADAGLLVVLDQHNSNAGWCCEHDAEDGAWFTDRFPESSWIEALATMAQQYRDNLRVIAMEIRNEVRDSPDVDVVWGTTGPRSQRKTADWAAAATRAGNAVLHADPNLLIFVTGLCYGFDLRGARDQSVILERPGRLVWVGHVYHWYLPEHSHFLQVGGFKLKDQWNTVGWVLVGCALSSACFATFIMARRCLRVSRAVKVCPSEDPACPSRSSLFVVGKPPLSVVLAEAIALTIGACGIVLLAIANVAEDIGMVSGCSDLGRRQGSILLSWGTMFLAGGFCTAAITFIASYASRQKQTRSACISLFNITCTQSDASRTAANVANAEIENSTACELQPGRGSVLGLLSAHARSCTVPFFIVVSLVLFVMAFIAFTNPHVWRLHIQLEDMLGFVTTEGQPYTAPLFVSEIGTAQGSQFWAGLVDYINKKDLDFAYWPINGQKWKDGEWKEETYGLLSADWASIVRAWRLHGLGLALAH